MSVVMRSHQFQIFDVTRVTLLVKQRTFPIEQKHKPVAIFELLTTRARGRTAGFMDTSKSGYGAIRLSLYLIIINVGVF